MDKFKSLGIDADVLHKIVQALLKADRRLGPLLCQCHGVRILRRGYHNQSDEKHDLTIEATTCTLCGKPVGVAFYSTAVDMRNAIINEMDEEPSIN